ncbi:DUF5618 family protein [Dyadobacter sp. LHD-138]|uniref:DUF5618 family protein n=1 Tax=Dyadobacter sp. LHD-138 TaxID=3071413 RepID=UPI0027E06A2C|nr:DUF5618 family protein [Dyadobacter sp. LHD-138]MDQ6478898.1 DUF5618 family protein [Dyadobacter sp. LHD-138]
MDSISEARRHLANAKEILRDKARKEDDRYQDKKYIKMAGHTAYTGVLLALDALFGNKKKNARKSVEWYQLELSRIDKKITGSFADVYEILHLSMGYDGVQNAKVIIIGLQEAENIINWTEQKMAKAVA